MSSAEVRELGHLGRVAADLSSKTGVSFTEAYDTLLAASEALARAWDKGVKAAIDARPWSSPAPDANPYRDKALEEWVK